LPYGRLSYIITLSKIKSFNNQEEAGDIMFKEFFPVQDPVLVFAILMLIALIAPLISGKLKMPGIVGLIVTGIILGPHVLGVLERGNEIQLLGTVGLLYIMFLAGLELDRVQFIRHRYHSVVFGVLTFSIPLILGALMARHILGFSWKASILLASMFSSHTLLTYPIASRLGLARQRSVTTTIGGTIITDTAAMLVLAIIAALHKGESSIFFWPRFFMYMVLYTVSMLIILPRLSKWFFRNIVTDGIIAFTGVIAAVYFCSYMAYAANLESIIGAFFAGLILNSFIPEKSALMNRIQFVGHSLFIPFFLISVGMLVDIRVLFTSSNALAIAAVMVFAGILTKWMAAYSTQKLIKYSHEEGMLIYGLSVNQAAATLAAVLVGYNIGIFSESVLTGTIIMILVTSLAGAWLTDRYARKVALKEDEEPYQPSNAPHRILIPMASSATAAELMNLAILLRRHNSHEPLYPLTVVQSGDNADERIADAEKLLGHAVVQALEADIPVVPIARAAIDTTVGIEQAAVDLRISMIITAWKGSVSSNSRVFGRTLDAALDNSSQMVFVSRCLVPINTMKRVIVTIPPLIDHQPGFATAIRAIKTLAHQLDASLLTVSVPPTMEKVSEIIENSQPKVQGSYVKLDRWDELFSWFKTSLGKDDLLIMVSVRKGRLAWQPNLNRMPRLISQQLKGINFVVVYPPEMSWDEEQKAQEPKPFSPLLFFPASHIRLDLQGLKISDAIAQLLKPAFYKKEAAAKSITDMLVVMAETEPMELSPGVVLLHAHIADIQMPTAFLAINKQGWKLPHAAEPVKTLFILLSSKDASPEVHLKALADLIRPFHKSHSVNQLSRVKSIEEVLVFWGHKL
jgi:Kef-type K+ transport system membrane component KefB/mannitol/fructose-specific phosphotransferase system IIA component (Ntr-type)